MMKFWIAFAVVFTLTCLSKGGVCSGSKGCKPFNESTMPCDDLGIKRADVCYERYHDDDADYTWWEVKVTCHVGFQLECQPSRAAQCYFPRNRKNYRWDDSWSQYRCVTGKDTARPICQTNKDQSGHQVINKTTSALRPATATTNKNAQTASTSITGYVSMCFGVAISLIVLNNVVICLYKKFRRSQRGQESSNGRVSFGYINPVNGETDSRGSYINSTRAQKVSSISANCYDYADNVVAGDQYMYAEMV